MSDTRIESQPSDNYRRLLDGIAYNLWLYGRERAGALLLVEYGSTEDCRERYEELQRCIAERRSERL